jgi:cob(I)alamin adenosyltransferase
MGTFSKRGDDGTTSLRGGERRPKDDPRVEAYGTLDELSALLGLAVARLEDPAGSGDPQPSAVLRRIQTDLYRLGALLSGPGNAPSAEALEPDLGALERDLEETDRRNPPLRSFIRPGGREVAALLHVARAVCRRAERRVVALSRAAPVDPVALRYLNRLADFLFSLARALNAAQGRADEPLGGDAT